jgi:hypothetical protein
VGDTNGPLGSVTQTHVDPTGRRWSVTVHWARVDGAAVPVGLDLHALHEDGQGGGVLNAAVLRSLRMGELIERSRRAATWDTRPTCTGSSSGWSAAPAWRTSSCTACGT